MKELVGVETLAGVQRVSVGVGKKMKPEGRIGSEEKCGVRLGWGVEDPEHEPQWPCSR
jgi:hypothetical protein